MKRVALAVVGLVLATGTLTSFLVALGTEAPLLIEGIEDVRMLDGVYGDGTAASPYVIEGVVIDAEGESNCLVLSNTDAHIVIRDGAFSNAAQAGVVLQDASNVWIIACTFEGNETGIHVSSDSANIVLTLNSFRENHLDILASPTSVSLTDGFVGNWWDGYEGTDATGDGIGEQVHQVQSGSTTLLIDDKPIVVPYADPVPLDPSQIRLELSYEEGAVLASEIAATMELQYESFGILSTLVGESEMLYRTEVVSAPGTGFFQLRETIASDTGRISADGIPQPYVSSAGTYALPTHHRFGSVADFGDTAGEEASSPLEAPIVYPARPISPGHTWTSAVALDAEALEVPSGEATAEGTYTFLRTEERNGRLCAVIDGWIEYSMEGEEYDIWFGSLAYRGTGTIVSEYSIDVATGRSVSEVTDIEMSLGIYSEGSRIGSMTMTASGTYEEKPEQAAVEDVQSAAVAALQAEVAALADEVNGLRTQVDDLQNEIGGLASELAAASPRIAYLDAEEAFTVFLDVTADMREDASQKMQEISDLQSDYAAATISWDEYQQRSNELQAELLDMQLAMDVTVLDRMIDSEDFADIRPTLLEWRGTAQLVAAEVSNLVSMATMGVADPAEYESRFTTAQNAFQQLDQGLSQAATLKIVQVAQQIAVEEGFDMVLRVKNVLVYRNPIALVDITDAVKRIIADYL